MQSIIGEWGLDSVDLMAATTDDNMKAALQHMDCLHILNLAVEKAIAVLGIS